jgi:dsRNA-specific ribonuclease
MKIKHILKNETMKLSHFNENHVIRKGVEMINYKILSAAFNTVFGAITVDDGLTTANFVYWTMKKWKDHHVDVI